MALYNTKPNYQTLIASLSQLFAKLKGLIAVKSNTRLFIPFCKELNNNNDINSIAGSSLSEFRLQIGKVKL